MEPGESRLPHEQIPQQDVREDMQVTVLEGEINAANYQFIIRLAGVVISTIGAQLAFVPEAPNTPVTREDLLSVGLVISTVYFLIKTLESVGEMAAKQHTASLLRNRPALQPPKNPINTS